MEDSLFPIRLDGAKQKKKSHSILVIEFKKSKSLKYVSFYSNT